MLLPLIGISCGIFHDLAWCPPSFGHRRTYSDAIVQAGGVPLLVPPLDDSSVLRAAYERVDGVLLSGGGDIAPEHYGEAPHAALGAVDPLRDQAELMLTRWAIADGKPLLGICRGIQVVNVALGGTLYQDIGAQYAATLDHSVSYKQEDWTYAAHELQLAPDSRLATALGVTRLTTNSLHHQALKDLAPGLRPVAWAPDGVVEAVELTGPQFVLGVQGHPEALQAQADERWQGLFRAFVACCADYRGIGALAAHEEML